jgi:hypothetical protein
MMAIPELASDVAMQRRHVADLRRNVIQEQPI